MTDQITPNLVDFELIVQHYGPVNLHVVNLALARFQSAAVRANLSTAERLATLQALNAIPPLGETTFIALAQIEITRNASRLLWLESVEPGSSVFRGKVANIANGVFWFYLGAVGSGVLDRQDWHREFVDAVDQAGKEFVWNVVDYLNHSLPRPNNPDGTDIKAEIVGDRVRIVVHPRKQETQISYSPMPPLR